MAVSATISVLLRTPAAVRLLPVCEQGGELAKKLVFVSDLSGETIEEGKGAKIRISFDDQRKGNFELDVTAGEADALTSKGRKVGRRGRRPKSDPG